MEEQEEEPKRYIWHIMAVFLALIIISMIIPAGFINVNPEPKNIPTLSDIRNRFEISIPKIENRNDYTSLVRVDDDVKRVTDYIVTTSCESNEKVCFAKAIFYFVRDELKYVNDPAEYEYVKTTSESLASGGGDCDDASVAIASMMKSIGFNSRLVFVPGHVYVEAEIPSAVSKYKTEGNWVVMDGTCASCGFGELAQRYRDLAKRRVLV